MSDDFDFGSLSEEKEVTPKPTPPRAPRQPKEDWKQKYLDEKALKEENIERENLRIRKFDELTRKYETLKDENIELSAERNSEVENLKAEVQEVLLHLPKAINYDKLMEEVNTRKNVAHETLYIQLNPRGKSASYNRRNQSRYVKCAKATIDIIADIIRQTLSND